MPHKMQNKAQTDPYSQLAVFYDTVKGINDTNFVQVIAALEGERAISLLAFAEYSNAKGAILDLGCGTGCLSCYLGFLGYSVVGIDTSLGMLELAEKRKEKFGLPGVRFMQTDFSAPGPVDIGECIGFAYAKEVFNNLLEEKVLLNCLFNLYSLLAPSTTFFSEMYTELGMVYLMRKVMRNFETFVYSQSGTYDPLKRQGCIEYMLQSISEPPQITKVNLPVRYWTRDELSQAYSQAGFKKVEFFDSRIAASSINGYPSVTLNPFSLKSETFIVKAEKR